MRVEILLQLKPEDSPVLEISELSFYQAFTQYDSEGMLTDCGEREYYACHAPYTPINHDIQTLSVNCASESPADSDGLGVILCCVCNS
jgi:hypothetical protein